MLNRPICALPCFGTRLKLKQRYFWIQILHYSLLALEAVCLTAIACKDLLVRYLIANSNASESETR